jgi:hypothetical protein
VRPRSPLLLRGLLPLLLLGLVRAQAERITMNRGAMKQRPLRRLR